MRDDKNTVKKKELSQSMREEGSLGTDGGPNVRDFCRCQFVMLRGNEKSSALLRGEWQCRCSKHPMAGQKLKFGFLIRRKIWAK